MKLLLARVGKSGIHHRYLELSLGNHNIWTAFCAWPTDIGITTAVQLAWPTSNTHSYSSWLHSSRNIEVVLNFSLFNTKSWISMTCQRRLQWRTTKRCSFLRQPRQASYTLMWPGTVQLQTLWLLFAAWALFCNKTSVRHTGSIGDTNRFLESKHNEGKVRGCFTMTLIN